MVLALFPDAIRLAAVVAACLVFATWALSPAADDGRTRVFRRAWASMAYAVVCGLLPGLWSDYGPYGRMDSAMWLASMVGIYVAFTLAAYAQADRHWKSLFGSGVILLSCFGVSAAMAAVLP